MANKNTVIKAIRVLEAASPWFANHSAKRRGDVVATFFEGLKRFEDSVVDRAAFQLVTEESDFNLAALYECCIDVRNRDSAIRQAAYRRESEIAPEDRISPEKYAEFMERIKKIGTNGKGQNH